MRKEWRILKAYLFHRPFILYHQPTWRCDCRCAFCDVWKIEHKNEQELEIEELKPILKKFWQAGFLTYTLWGGEPLYYKEIIELVDFAHQLGFQVIICTSASRLEEFAEGLSKKIYHLLLSLEAVGEKHDNIRAHPGLFQKVLRGVEKLRQLNPKEKIIIWSNLSQINLDQVPALAQLARELKVFIEFFPMAHFPGFNDHLVLNPEEREEVFSQVISLKAKGYPILNTFYSLKLMKDGARFRCNMPRFSLQMLWDGSLWPCEPRILKPENLYGNGLTFEPKSLSKSKSYHLFSSQLENCNLCLLPCVAHFANNYWIQALRRYFTLLYYFHFYQF